MPDLQDVVIKKFSQLVGGLEPKPERLNALLGDGKGVVNVPGRAGYVHIRLDDGTYYGVAFNTKVPFENDLPVVVGYSHEQPELFQVLETRTVPAATAPGVPAGTIGNVGGLTAVWQQDDVLISWTPLAPSALFHNYRVTIDGVDYLTTVPNLVYTRTMNEADHSGTWADEVVISLVAVDIYGGISATPATATATWTRPTMPDCANGTLEWNNDDALFRWDDIVKPYTFSHYLVTIVTSASIAYVATANFFLYTNEMNRIDNGGLPDTEIEVEVVAVDRDGYTSFIPLVINGVNTNPTGDTVHDEFNTYGGDVIAQNGSAGLHWLSVIACEGTQGELFGFTGVQDTSYTVQGSYALKNPSSGSGNGTCWRENPPYPLTGWDFTAEGRLTDDDFITLAIFASSATPGGSGFKVIFLDDNSPSKKRAEKLFDALSSGWNYLKVKRSDMSIESGFNWEAITYISIAGNLFPIIDTWADDLRMVKADPDNPNTFNDTGAAWDFSGGTWHIYEDVPTIAYALGQIDTTSSARKTAIRAGTYVVSNHVAGGIYLREAGAAGLLAMTTDGSDGYEIKVDSVGDTVKLLRWTAGVSTELGSISATINTSTRYYLGLMRDGNYLRVFLSTTVNVFSAENLIMYIEDTTYVQGKVGFTAYGANIRFFNVRGGSPEHALTAEYAFGTDQFGHTHTAMPGPLQIGAVSDGDYLQVAADGSLTYHGDATFHLDEKGVLTGARITSPSSKIIQDDAESAFYFKDTATTADYLWMNIQLNHDRKHGAIISPHLHWWQASATVPNWLIQYRYQKQGAAKTAAWTSVKYTTHAYAYSSGTLCQITDFGDITPPSGDGVSDVVQIRIIRDTGNASGLFSGADGLSGNVYVYDFDLHKECDSPGSREEYIK